jgi:hypothetical protein
MPRSNVHTNAILSNFALGYSQQGLWISDQASPVKMVKKESDTYYSYLLKDVITPRVNVLRANGAPANQSTWDFTTGTYQCHEYALKDVATDRDKRNADLPINVEFDTTKYVTDQLMLAREQRVAAALFNATTYTSYTDALSSTTYWSNHSASTSVPFTNVETARDSILKNSLTDMNTIIMGYEVFKSLRNHPDLIARIVSGGSRKDPALFDASDIAKAFDVEKVLVGRAIYNSANEGQTATPAYVWGKNVLFCHTKSNPGQKDITSGMTFRTQAFNMKKWYDNDVDGTWIQGSMIDDEVVIAAGAGYYLTAVVA